MNTKQDNVNHPKHYNSNPSGIECIAVVEHLSFNLGNAIKYLWRHEGKNGIEDLQKAQWYISREITRLSNWKEPVVTDLYPKCCKPYNYVVDGATFKCNLSKGHIGDCGPMGVPIPYITQPEVERQFPISKETIVTALRAVAAKSQGGPAYWFTELANELERT